VTPTPELAAKQFPNLVRLVAQGFTLDSAPSCLYIGMWRADFFELGTLPAYGPTEARALHFLELQAAGIFPIGPEVAA
jgi:hypothetical protein